MEIDNNLVYLTIQEQKATGLPSPMDIRTMDLHTEREKADRELDRLEMRATLDQEEMLAQERATLPQRLAQAHARSDVIRTICREAALGSMIKP